MLVLPEFKGMFVNRASLPEVLFVLTGGQALAATALASVLIVAAKPAVDRRGGVCLSQMRLVEDAEVIAILKQKADRRSGKYLDREFDIVRNGYGSRHRVYDITRVDFPDDCCRRSTREEVAPIPGVRWALNTGQSSRFFHLEAIETYRIPTGVLRTRRAAYDIPVNGCGGYAPIDKLTIPFLENGERRTA